MRWRKTRRGLGTYQDLVRTWDILGRDIQGLIVTNTKADKARWISASNQLLEIEPTHALQVRHLEAFKAKLQKNLQHSNNRLEVPMGRQQWAYRQRRNSAVELEGELDPDISFELENFDPQSTTDQDSQVTQEGAQTQDTSTTVDVDEAEL